MNIWVSQGPPPPPLSVVAFTFINAENNWPLTFFNEDGEQVSVVRIQNGENINIQANTTPREVGSVRFEISGPISHTQTENVFPYALFGDIEGDYFGRDFPLGDYTITATAYSGPRGTGEAGEPTTLSFSIVRLNTETDITSFVLAEESGSANIDTVAHTVNVEVVNGTDISALMPTITVSEGAIILPSSEVPMDFTNPVIYQVISEDLLQRQNWTVNVIIADPVPTITDFVLVNATDNSDILVLEDGMELDSNTIFNGMNLNIRANANPEIVGSVRFRLRGALSRTHTENVAPYALFRDIAGDYLGRNLPVGNYSLTATPFSESDATGVIGETLTIGFSIITPPAAIAASYDVSLYPNAATTNVNLTVSDREVDIVKIQIFDLQGRKVAAYTPAEVQNGEGYRLPVYRLPGGMYIVNTIDNEGKVSQRRLLVDRR